MQVNEPDGYRTRHQPRLRCLLFIQLTRRIHEILNSYRQVSRANELCHEAEKQFFMTRKRKSVSEGPCGDPLLTRRLTNHSG
jgi:hypothetical protein